MNTPDEARQCWCPFARFAYPTGSARLRADIGENYAELLPHHTVANRPLDADCNCIADECMAWRWGDWQKVVFPAGGYDQQEAPKDVEMGYCGLAGKP